MTDDAPETPRIPQRWEAYSYEQALAALTSGDADERIDASLALEKHGKVDAVRHLEAARRVETEPPARAAMGAAISMLKG